MESHPYILKLDLSLFSDLTVAYGFFYRKTEYRKNFDFCLLQDFPGSNLKTAIQLKLWSANISCPEGAERLQRNDKVLDHHCTVSLVLNEKLKAQKIDKNKTAQKSW